MEFHYSVAEAPNFGPKNLKFGKKCKILVQKPKIWSFRIEILGFRGRGTRFGGSRGPKNAISVVLGASGVPGGQNNEIACFPLGYPNEPSQVILGRLVAAGFREAASLLPAAAAAAVGIIDAAVVSIAICIDTLAFRRPPYHPPMRSRAGARPGPGLVYTGISVYTGSG